MVEVLGPSCHKRENFPPEIDVYKVPHSRFDKLGKKHCIWRFLEMFLNCWLLQDEGTCHFCGTDFATDWGELISNKLAKARKMRKPPGTLSLKKFGLGNFGSKKFGPKILAYLLYTFGKYTFGKFTFGKYTFGKCTFEKYTFRKYIFGKYTFGKFTFGK